MVNHIVTRIIESCSREFQFDFTAEHDQKITAIYKWGCDGSSGHSTYRQGFVNENKNISDDSLFAVCIVPLQILKGTSTLWKNQRPSSTRYCRPLKILFQKESADLVRIHGADIIKISPLPIGQMSEEALEARNKDLSNIREQHTRKTSRKTTMEDLIHGLLCSSDPLIASLRSIQNSSSQENRENNVDKDFCKLVLDKNLI